jgi:phosphate transport system substrate-binding protein
MKYPFLAGTLAAIVVVGLAACGRKGGGADGEKRVEIRAKGSDTMIQLATAWAEAYRSVKSNVYINASGGGSGTGIAALQNGTTDICNSSREIKPEEKTKVKETTGKDVQEYVVCYDALAVYTHKSNPITDISIEELREIWAAGGSIDNWEQLNPSFQGKIAKFGRQNNSGTYDYFREHVCGKDAAGKQRELKPGISEMNGSAEVVENVAKTPTGMGYSGMGYKTGEVNWLKVSKKKGESGLAPGTDVARSGQYPIARKLYLYTAGEPSTEIKAFLDWVVSPAGQAIVAKEGFVPLK